jgi:AcrR family transcriptional regulator
MRNPSRPIGSKLTLRELRSARYRDNILEAGERLIVKKGYSEFSMDELARAVRCTKRTVYSYFPGKQDVFLSVVQRAFAALNDHVERCLGVEGETTGREWIMNLGQVLLGYYREHPGAFSIIADFENREPDFTGAGETAAACYAEGERLMSLLKKHLTQGIRDGSIRPALAVDTTAILLWSLLTGIIITLARKKEYLERTHGLNAASLLGEAQRFVRWALQPDNESPRRQR